MGIRGLAISESISLYGGLAVFGGFVLYEYVAILSVSVELTDSVLVHKRFCNMLACRKRGCSNSMLSMNLLALSWICSIFCTRLVFLYRITFEP